MTTVFLSLADMESIIHLDSRHNEQRRGGGRRQQQQHHHHHLPLQQVTSGDSDRHRQPQQPHHQHHRPRRRPNPRRSPPDDPAALVDSALPSDSDHNFDHHSSEEELEVINSGHHPAATAEKRKWVADGGAADYDRDDELLTAVCCPVQFRTSPPAHAHKPGKCLRQGNIPPHELCVSVSPRKRHRRTPTTAIQRPCLDFEKMQQVMTAVLRDR